MKLKHFLFVVLCIATSAPAQFRIASYNIAKCIGDHSAIDYVVDAISQDDSHGKALPLSIIMFQEVSAGNENTLHQFLGDEYSMGTYTNKGESGGAQAMFYNSSQLKEDADAHKDIFTGATRYGDRWRLEGIGDYEDIIVWVYSVHFKASKGSENKEQRLFGANAILEDIATLPQESHVILVGDMNFYNSSEPAYKALTTNLIDPLGTSEWSGEDDAIKHTQSPRKVRATKGTPGSGLIHGGLDDRFDFQFISASLQDGEGLDVVANSYHAFGNDGNHYDVAINDGDNSFFAGDTARSNEIANALHMASDHVPVVADYEVVGNDAKEVAPK